MNPLENPALSRYGYYAYRVIQMKRDLVWIKSRRHYGAKWRSMATNITINNLNCYRAALLSGYQEIQP